MAFKDAYDRASVSGTEQRLKKIRDNMDDIRKVDITSLDTQEVRAVQQVVRQVRRHLERISKMIDEKLP